MAIKYLVEAIAKKHGAQFITLNAPSTPAKISTFERRTGFILPADFIEFYTICNGFACNEDLFNMTRLSEITDYGTNWFHFAEYMIYADMWGLTRTSDGEYEIFQGNYPGVFMTSSLEEFLTRFLAGNVFEPGGLYDWLEVLKGKGN